MRLIDLCEEWLAECALEGMSARSVQAYREHVRATFGELAGGAGLDVEDLAAEHWRRGALTRALLSYRSRPDRRHRDAAAAPGERSAASLRLRRAALRAFSAWAAREGHLESDPAATLPLPRASSMLTPARAEALSAAECATLIAASRGARDRLVLGLVLGMGLTPGEVASLPLDALDLREKALAVGDRQLSCPEWVTDAARSYLPVRTRLLQRRGQVSAQLIVLGASTDARARARSVTQICERTGKRAELSEERTSPRALRASFAQAALENGATVVAVCAQLGLSLPALRSLIAPIAQVQAVSVRGPVP